MAQAMHSGSASPNLDRVELPSEEILRSLGSMRQNDFNEAHLIPFDHSWTREVVIRAPTDPARTTTARNSHPIVADAYYRAPCGKKLRSTVDVHKYLRKKKITNLTVANFSYAKKSLFGGLQPYEVVRPAKQRRGNTQKATDGSRTDSFSGASGCGESAESSSAASRDKEEDSASAPSSSNRPARTSKGSLGDQPAFEMVESVPAQDQDVKQRESDAAAVSTGRRRKQKTPRWIRPK